MNRFQFVEDPMASTQPLTGISDSEVSIQAVNGSSLVSNGRYTGGAREACRGSDLRHRRHGPALPEKEPVGGGDEPVAGLIGSFGAH